MMLVQILYWRYFCRIRNVSYEYEYQCYVDRSSKLLTGESIPMLGWCFCWELRLLVSFRSKVISFHPSRMQRQYYHIIYAYHMHILSHHIIFDKGPGVVSNDGIHDPNELVIGVFSVYSRLNFKCYFWRNVHTQQRGRREEGRDTVTTSKLSAFQ